MRSIGRTASVEMPRKAKAANSSSGVSAGPAGPRKRRMRESTPCRSVGKTDSSTTARSATSRRAINRASPPRETPIAPSGSPEKRVRV
jgi:hypothetical protein